MAAPSSGSPRRTSAFPTFSFKAKLLSKIQRQREREEKHALGVKERRAAERKKRRMELRNTNQAKMVAEAAARAKEFAETGARRMAYLEELKNGVKDGEAAQQTRRAFYAQLKRVIESSDVIIQVLDARDPEGCRASHIERMIVPKGKKLILLVNKVDLVPRHVTEAWLKHLRLEFPAIAFKANTQSGGRSLGRAMGKAEAAKDAVLSGAKCVGAETLMQLLKNYSRSLGMKTSITVGLVGYPNVGKSSVINSLKRARAAAVSPTPGMTKVMQEVTIDRNIKLLDCPGIIFGADAIDQMGHNENDSKGTGLVLRNCIGVDQLPDPVGAVEVLLEKVPTGVSDGVLRHRPLRPERAAHLRQRRGREAREAQEGRRARQGSGGPLRAPRSVHREAAVLLAAAQAATSLRGGRHDRRGGLVGAVQPRPRVQRRKRARDREPAVEGEAGRLGRLHDVCADGRRGRRGADGDGVGRRAPGGAVGGRRDALTRLGPARRRGGFDAGKEEYNREGHVNGFFVFGF